MLWEQGSCTVRQVHDVLEARRAAGYTTVLKLMQIMAEKGLVEREESARAHVYKAAIPKEETQEQLVGDLMDRAFGGSASELVMRALSTRPASRDELKAIRKMLKDYEGSGQ